jgi:AcrR family transcriptional regulator
MATDRPVRRQARGERRMAQILDAAAEVIGETGFSAASTNLIAARAGVSPGTLYQFFPGKPAIAAALAERFAAAMTEAHRRSFDPAGVVGLDLGVLVDRVVDPLVEANVAHPAVRAMLTAGELSEPLAAAVAPLHGSLAGRIEGLIAVRVPELPPAERARHALILLHVVRGLLAPIVAAEGAARAGLVTGLKDLLVRYLEPIEQAR